MVELFLGFEVDEFEFIVLLLSGFLFVFVVVVVLPDVLLDMQKALWPAKLPEPVVSSNEYIGSNSSSSNLLGTFCLKG